MKKFVSFVLLFLMSFSSITFASKNKLIGKWKLIGKDNYFIEFLDEETMISYEGSSKVTITYKPIKENLFKFQAMGMIGVCEFKLEGNDLVFTKEYDCAWKGEKYHLLSGNKSLNDTQLSADLLLNAGYRFYVGQGVSQDHKKAAELYTLAVEKGSVHAIVKLGTLYALGHGVPRDYPKAVELFQQAADKGDATAQATLAAFFLQGLGTPKNYTKAAELYELAAEQEQADAQYNLGLLFLQGLGVPKDKARAIELIRLAAEQGHDEASKKLGAIGVL